MKYFYTTLVTVTALSILLTTFHTHSMGSLVHKQASTSKNQPLLYTVPKEIWRSIVFLALKDELDKFRCSTLLQGHTNAVTLVKFSPDGKTILTQSLDKTARLWDVSTGQQLHILKGHSDWSSFSSIAFSPDGKTVLTGSDDKTARLWDVSTGQQLHILRGHIDWIHCVVFSTDGKTVLTGSWDKTARLWDVFTGQQLHILRGHTNYITSVACSP
ncbi:WD40 repeat domain-containing protein, partial [Candidatus Dependentiae bacterium]|nr:WD40 repeat domain-containing protein [Candidatus Dependentiae bacterium]